MNTFRSESQWVVALAKSFSGWGDFLGKCHLPCICVCVYVCLCVCVYPPPVLWWNLGHSLSHCTHRWQSRNYRHESTIRTQEAPANAVFSKCEEADSCFQTMPNFVKVFQYQTVFNTNLANPLHLPWPESFLKFCMVYMLTTTRFLIKCFRKISRSLVKKPISCKGAPTQFLNTAFHHPCPWLILTIWRTSKETC